MNHYRSLQNTDSGLPEQLDFKDRRDLGERTRREFIELVERYRDDLQAVFGSNEPLLQGLIQSSSESSTITFDGVSSCLWQDHNHVTRDPQKDFDENPKASPEADIKNFLLPWERWQEGLQYTEPTIRDGYAQAIDLEFPVLDLTPSSYEFRLFLLLPSSGNNESPLEGHLVVSRLYLHSCFKALRHSRGNPGCWGTILVDGRSVEITKNLEVFLRHVRHPRHAQMFYIRELCINRQDENEKKALLTGQFQGLVEDSSCGVIDMNNAMYMLDGRGLIPELSRVSEKRWFDVDDEDQELPWHLPMVLRCYQHHPLHDKVDITEAEISMLDDYEYVPIDLAAREIRLLGVYPTQRPEDPIIVDVAYVPLRMNTNYHALSYVWGPKGPLRYLKNSNAKIGVTENLYDAIHTLREQILHKDGGPCYFWVDAICIDQSNDIEKAWTIAKMHDIFEAAASVQICIAPTRLLTQKVIGLLENFAHDKINFTSEEPLDELGNLDAWADLFLLFRLPYFSRRWIVQELASASAPHVMMAGHQARALRTVSIAAAFMHYRFPELVDLWMKNDHPILQQCEELSRCLDLEDERKLFNNLDDIRHLFRRVQKIDHVRHLHVFDQPPSFLFLAILTQSSRCADPRDVLYSLWNICREKSLGLSPLDYRSSIEECYTDFTKFYASQTDSLDIMCILQSAMRHNQFGDSDDSLWHSAVEFPSWCPDYRYGGDISSLIRYEFVTYGISSYPNMDFAPFHADSFEPGRRPPACFRFAGSNLIVQGVVLDTVEYISEIPFTILPWDIVGHNFERFNFGMFDDFCSKISRSSNGFQKGHPSVNSVFSDTVNMLVGETGIIEAEMTGDDIGERLTFWSHDDKSPYQRMASMFERATEFTKGRRLVATGSVYMGLAPSYAQKGYKIAILLGCSVPVLLEEVDVIDIADTNTPNLTSSKSSSVRPVYRLRGDCFVQHWMQGQMMKRYGDTTEKAWKALSGSAFELCIK